MIIGRAKGIPFIRVFPDYTTKMQMVERPAEVDLLACSFISQGGRYLIAKISDHEVKLAAMVEGFNGDVYEVATEVSADGIELPLAIDRLVRESVRKIAAVN